MRNVPCASPHCVDYFVTRLIPKSVPCFGICVGKRSTESTQTLNTYYHVIFFIHIIFTIILCQEIQYRLLFVLRFINSSNLTFTWSPPGSEAARWNHACVDLCCSNVHRFLFDPSDNLHSDWGFNIFLYCWILGYSGASVYSCNFQIFQNIWEAFIAVLWLPLQQRNGFRFWEPNYNASWYVRNVS